MKTIKPIFFLLFGLFLFSCNQGTELNKGSYEKYILERLQRSVETEYYRGKEKLGAIKETVLDKSERNRSNRSIPILNSALKIDSACHQFIEMVTDIKLDMIKNKAKLIGLQKSRNVNWLLPIDFDFDNLTLYEPSRVKQKIEQVQTEILKVRSLIAQRITRYDSRDSIRGWYSFSDPYLNYFDSYKNSYKRLDVAISNVAQDDKEALKKIYVEMTKLVFSFPSDVDSGFEFFALLTAAEQGVFEARADAIALLRSRVSGCSNYTFDRIIPLFEAPSNAYVGDTIEVSSLMAAYDSDREPLVIVNGVKFKDIRKGIAYHKFVLLNENDFKLKGTVTYLNKSGVPKTMPFGKTIQVIPKRE